MFMTQAERSKLDAKQNKRDEQDCFGFLRDLRDVSVQLIRSQPTVLSDFRLLLPRLTCIDQVSGIRTPLQSPLVQLKPVVPIDDPDYDPRTVYIPPGAWKDFTPFEKQVSRQLRWAKAAARMPMHPHLHSSGRSSKTTLTPCCFSRR
jgi:hypothetical protein